MILRLLVVQARKNEEDLLRILPFQYHHSKLNVTKFPAFPNTTVFGSGAICDCIRNWTKYALHRNLIQSERDRQK